MHKTKQQNKQKLEACLVLNSCSHYKKRQQSEQASTLESNFEGNNA